MEIEKELSADASSPMAMRKLAADDQVRSLTSRRVELNCSRCGYGIVSRDPPERCPMCGTTPIWVEPSRPPSRRAVL